VVVLVLERVFVVGGEVVAATTRVLAGRGRDLDQISVAINQETGPAFFPVLVEFFPEWIRAAWCCALLQVEFPCLLVILLVDFLLPFGGNCACRTRAPCWLLVIARLGLHVC
jgi:hypothetical protein